MLPFAETILAPFLPSFQEPGLCTKSDEAERMADHRREPIWEGCYSTDTDTEVLWLPKATSFDSLAYIMTSFQTLRYVLRGTKGRTQTGAVFAPNPSSRARIRTRDPRYSSTRICSKKPNLNNSQGSTKTSDRTQTLPTFTTPRPNNEDSQPLPP